jgi:hypothetical protein
MAAAFEQVVRQKLKAKPRPEVDVKALREEINARYENTLRYLGR